MAETYEDYGDYSEELLYQEKSKLGKFFSFRTLKKILKWLFVFLVILVYGLLFFRLCTGGPPKALSRMVWTEKTLAAYTAAGGNLAVYSQEPVEHVAQDGYFGIYDILYIPEAKQLELTVRYNNSSTDKLRETLVEKETEARRTAIRDRLKAENEELSGSALSSLVEAELEKSLADDPITIALSETPFVFLLRDDFGRVYTSYAYLSGERTVYQYLRIVFEDVDLFGGAKTPAVHEYPAPQVDVPAYLYKGANAGNGEAVSYLYLDMYYEKDINFYGESFAYPLLVYRSASELTPYDYKKEVASTATEGLVYVDLLSGT